MHCRKCNRLLLFYRLVKNLRVGSTISNAARTEAVHADEAPPGAHFKVNNIGCASTFRAARKRLEAKCAREYLPPDCGDTMGEIKTRLRNENYKGCNARPSRNRRAN